MNTMKKVAALSLSLLVVAQVSATGESTQQPQNTTKTEALKNNGGNQPQTDGGQSKDGTTSTSDANKNQNNKDENENQKSPSPDTSNKAIEPSIFARAWSAVKRSPCTAWNAVKKTPTAVSDTLKSLIGRPTSTEVATVKAAIINISRLGLAARMHIKDFKFENQDLKAMQALVLKKADFTKENRTSMLDKKAKTTRGYVGTFLYAATLTLTNKKEKGTNELHLVGDYIDTKATVDELKNFFEEWKKKERGDVDEAKKAIAEAEKKSAILKNAESKLDKINNSLAHNIALREKREPKATLKTEIKTEEKKTSETLKDVAEQSNTQPAAAK